MAERESPTISDEDMPRYVRRYWERYQEATADEREAEKISLGFWIGGKHQWRPGETETRQGNNRPWISINRCKPAVDQVENEARNNPPGPQAHPVGESGADKDGADILEGLIREYEYRSDAKTAYVLALRCGAAAMRGVFEMGTEFAGERTMEQQIVLKPIPDPNLMFHDPDARMPCMEDQMWAGKIRVLSREQLIENYGDKLKVLNKSSFTAMAEGAGGWMADVAGVANQWRGDLSTAHAWTGGARSEGPYYVCEFYMVHVSRTMLRLYTDSILRYDDEAVPKGVTVKMRDGEPVQRSESRRTIKKYVVTALDTIEKTDWLGDLIPYFWVLGPEMWMAGKRYRLSLISNAQDSQRMLNYTATSAGEIVGAMTKTPFIGFEGQFDVTNAQGFNPWDASNTQTFMYMEVKPTFATNPVTQESVLLPMPQRNTWEAPIARLMELATFFGEQIKAATSVFFEPSIRSASQVQSGSAIKALQAQSNIGTLNWQDQLHRAVQISYQQAAIILPQLYDGARVKTIVRPDEQHEIVEINREFPAHEMEGGRHRTKDGKLEPRNNITLGRYSLRVTAGPSFETRTEKSIENITEILKIAPQTLQNPAALSKIIRMVGEGNPEMESLADIISPDPNQAGTPEQMKAALMQAQSQAKQAMQVAQQLHQAIEAKLPQVEAAKFKTIMDNLTKIRVAEITASKDADKENADRIADAMEHLTGMAHDAATQATDHEHERGMQESQQQAAVQQSDQAHQQTLEQQQQVADNQPEPAGANQ